MAWRQVAYNYLKAAAALRASSREQLAVYMRLAADTDSATAYKRVLDDAGEVPLCSVLTLSGNAMAPAFLSGDRVRRREMTACSWCRLVFFLSFFLFDQRGRDGLASPSYGDESNRWAQR